MTVIYGTRAGADAYHLARNRPAWAALDNDAKDAALLLGSEYVDGRFRARFSGTKVGGRAQEREWPRDDAVDRDGNELVNTEAPFEVINASYEAALREALSPGSLRPDVTPAKIKKSETVFGAVSVDYVAGATAADLYPVVVVIDQIIAPVLVAAASTVSDLSGGSVRR